MPEERRVPQADQTGVADQQHQPDAGDGEDVNRAELADIEFAQHQRGDQDQHRQQAVPEAVAVMPPQRDVLAILGSEQIAHRSDPLSHALGEQALRPDE